MLEEKYKMYGLHYEPMTFTEGKEIIEKKLSNDVRDFVSDYWRQYAEMNGISEDEMQGCLDQIDDEMIEILKSCKNFCPHFHLSLQSACNETLKRMNRHYTIEQFKEIVKKLKKAFPLCSISTDIIVGFKGEIEEEFENDYYSFS